MHPEARSLYAEWDHAARDCVAILRSEAGRNPHDRDLTDLIGALATQSEEFRQLWAAHNVRLHTAGVKRFNHPLVGELELSFNRLEVMADPGVMILTFTAEPGPDPPRRSRCSPAGQQPTSRSAPGAKANPTPVRRTRRLRTSHFRNSTTMLAG